MKCATCGKEINTPYHQASMFEELSMNAYCSDECVNIAHAPIQASIKLNNALKKLDEVADAVSDLEFYLLHESDDMFNEYKADHKDILDKIRKVKDYIIGQK